MRLWRDNVRVDEIYALFYISYLLSLGEKSQSKLKIIIFIKIFENFVKLFLIGCDIV